MAEVATDVVDIRIGPRLVVRVKQHVSAGLDYQSKPEPLTSESEALEVVAERSGITVDKLVFIRAEMGLNDPRADD